MRKLALSVVLALASPLAFAGGVSTTVTLASDYLFDGASQTQGDGAFQASLDWSGDSGFYVGTWFSNVDFGPDSTADSEVDYYGGYGWEAEGGWEFAAGFARYTYNGSSSSNYTELTSSVTFPFGTKVLAYFADEDGTFESNKLKLKQSIEFLSSRQREALYLKYYEEMSYEQICEIMDINYQSVRNLISKGIIELRKSFLIVIILFTYFFLF